ncbi:MAG: CoA transferase subunit A [Dehalococcoidia bacterium]|nr:CoA transferase subunit A [Dehalococcoidia bacterium]
MGDPNMPDQKLMPLAEAIARFVPDGATLYLAGLSHLVPFAAGHEIIRQRKKDLTLCRATPDIVFEQMIAAGCARKVVFCWAGNPGIGNLRVFRRAVEKGQPNPIAIEEYTMFGLTGSLLAGAMKLPFFPVRTNIGSDLPAHNPRIKTIADPYTGETISVVPPLTPDVAILHVQRADANGNAQVWGITTDHRDAAFAATTVIVTAEEIVDEAVIRADPNRTIVPDFVVSAVAHAPFGAHPSYAQGLYDRDNAFYAEWDELSADPARVAAYQAEWIDGVPDRAAYRAKLGERADRLSVPPAWSGPVNYGVYA